MVFDKEDNNAMHYSHIVDSYQNNEVELHHFLYSDVYRVKETLLKDKASEPYQDNVDPLQTYRTTHENIYQLCKEQNAHQQVRLENNTWRKLVSGLINFLYNLFPFIGRWIAKDTDPDDSVKAVFTTPESSDPNKPEPSPEPTKMFCSEFVAHSMNIAASQSFTLFDDWKMKRRARYVPPQALAEHMEKEGLVEKVEEEQLDIPLMKMFR